MIELKAANEYKIGIVFSGGRKIGQLILVHCKESTQLLDQLQLLGTVIHKPSSGAEL